MAQRRARFRKKEYLEIFLLLCILRKQKNKKQKLLSEGSLNLSFTDV